MFTLEDVTLVKTWAEMLREHELENQCKKIGSWLKGYCGEISGVAFFLRDSRLGQQFLFRDNVSEDILQNLQAILPHLHQAVDAEYEAVFFIMRDGKLAIINGQESGQFLGELILATILSNQEHPIGIVALIVKPEAVQFLLDEEHRACWFSPFISSLLDNAICHEEKNRKISRLNLYQTVSSSLAHVGDRLLTHFCPD